MSKEQPQQPDYAEAHNTLGYRLHKAKRLDEAEAAFLHALELNPDFAEACNNLGSLLQETKRLHEAEAAFRRALKLKPDFAEAHNNLGNLLNAMKRLPEAEAAFHRALELKPDFSEAHNNLGTLLQETKRMSEAEAAFLRAIELKQDFTVAHINLGSLFHATKRLPEARASFLRALEFKPACAESQGNIACLLKEIELRHEAEITYLRTLELKSDYAEGCYGLGILFLKTKHLSRSEAAFRRVLALRPDHAGAYNNLGNLLMETKRVAEAEAAFKRAIELKSDYAEVYNNWGTLLHETNRLSEAEAAYRHAIELKPDYADACFNLGILRFEIKRLYEAETAFRNALELKPNFAEAKWNLSLLLLIQGRYAEAWPHYESRYEPNLKEAYTKTPSLSFPQWRGESLRDKSLLIISEQGFGDTVQFARYAPVLKARGVSCLTLVCNPQLKTLLETVEGIDAVMTDLASVSSHDYWSFSMSLPLHLSTTVDTIPATLPYLHVLPERVAYWHDRFPQKGLKVGLVWKGNPGNKNDANRSIPGLASLAPLLSVPEVTFIGLQTGPGEADAKQSPVFQPIINLGSDIRDFADTAAIVVQLDLVISVDTAVAHVAGALGKPCWLLLPAFNSDWRWLLDRTDSPWYPGVMRIFRQAERNHWGKPIRDVVEALKSWSHGFLFRRN